jgi:hypothetical protein
MSKVKTAKSAIELIPAAFDVDLTKAQALQRRAYVLEAFEREVSALSAARAAFELQFDKFIAASGTAKMIANGVSQAPTVEQVARKIEAIAKKPEAAGATTSTAQAKPSRARVTKVQPVTQDASMPIVTMHNQMVLILDALNDAEKAPVRSAQQIVKLVQEIAKLMRFVARVRDRDVIAHKSMTETRKACLVKLARAMSASPSAFTATGKAHLAAAERAFRGVKGPSFK